MSINEKYTDFYETNGLDTRLNEGIDCLCDNPKGCGYSCHSGTPCENFKPNFRFSKLKAMTTEEMDAYVQPIIDEENNRLVLIAEKEAKDQEYEDLKSLVQELKDRIITLESNTTTTLTKE